MDPSIVSITRGQYTSGIVSFMKTKTVPGREPSFVKVSAYSTVRPGRSRSATAPCTAVAVSGQATTVAWRTPAAFSQRMAFCTTAMIC